MTNQNQSPSSFINEVVNHLEAKNYASAISVFSDVHCQEYLRNNSWDLIPVLCKHITKESRHKNYELAICCERLLEKLASEANPEEAVLEFLDQMDEADYEKFDVVLRLLKIILAREMTNKIKSLEWTFNSIRSYMEQYSLNENSDEVSLPEGNDDYYSSDKVKEIESITNSVLTFFEDFVREVSENPVAEELRCLLSSRLLQMYDVFLPFINIELYPQFKLFESKVYKLILQLVPNPMTLLEFIFYRSLNVQKLKPNTSSKINRNIDDADLCSESFYNHVNLTEKMNPFEDETVVSNLAYGMFFYSLLTKLENEQAKVPLVYNPKYIMLSLIFVTVPFFNKTDISINCGLKFLNFLLNQLNNFLTKSDLYFSSHKAILIHLNNIMIFSTVEENRKLAVTCFKKYIESFNWEGRYFLLLNFRNHVHHSGTLGFLVSLLKDFVSTFLELPQSNQPNQKFLKYYKGKLLFDMIKKYCYLSSGSNIDLIENADHIISSLNALRYLVLRDKKNITDLRNFFIKIDEDFLKPLKENIISSKNIYELKLKELENTSSKSSIAITEPDIEVDLFVKGARASYSVRNFSKGPQNTQKDSDDQQYDNNIREKILDASLQFVTNHGWSREAISSGAESLGYSGVTSGIFPSGGADLINYFYIQCNQKLKDHMIEIRNKSDKPIKTKDFIQNSIAVRLQMIIPYIDTWAQAIAIMSLPPNVPVALANLLTLVDDICYYAGDKSVDFNWYTRRIGVGGIYKMTELYMLQDKSLDYKNTWNFLERRLTEAFQIQQVLSSSSEATAVAKDVVTSAFITARNILRLNIPR